MRVHGTLLFWRARNALRRLFSHRKPDPPEDPYSYTGAPRKPSSPRRSAGAAAKLDS
jgi:hypothetical protein